jgi:hypothetical protein
LQIVLIETTVESEGTGHLRCGQVRSHCICTRMPSNDVFSTFSCLCVKS